MAKQTLPKAAAEDYERQSEADIIAEIRAAKKAGTVRVGGLTIQRTPQVKLHRPKGK